jgi:hypothetical protein
MRAFMVEDGKNTVSGGKLGTAAQGFSPTVTAERKFLDRK